MTVKDIFQLAFEFIIPVILAVMAYFVIPLIKDARVKKYATEAVNAAEQIFGDGTGHIKYNYALELIKNKFNIDNAEIRMYIESAVEELNKFKDDILEDGTNEILDELTEDVSEEDLFCDDSEEEV